MREVPHGHPLEFIKKGHFYTALASGLPRPLHSCGGVRAPAAAALEGGALALLPLRPRPPECPSPPWPSERAGGQQQVGERRRAALRCGAVRCGKQRCGARGPLPAPTWGRPPAPQPSGRRRGRCGRDAPRLSLPSFTAEPVCEGQQHPCAGSPACSQTQEGFSHRDFFVFRSSNIRTHIETINTMKSTKYFISVVTVYFLYSEEISSFEGCTEAATSALDAALFVKTALLQLNLKTVIKKS